MQYDVSTLLVKLLGIIYVHFQFMLVCYSCITLLEMSYERGNPHEFTSLVRELAPPGELMSNKSFDFEFVNVEKPFESYLGANVILR